MSRREKIDTGGGGALGNAAFAGLDLPFNPSDPTDPTDRKAEGRSAKRPARRVELRREKAGRGGKTVTTLREFPCNLPLRELEALCRDLKKSCACGGALKGRVIELQGDVRDRVEPVLRVRGYAPVRAGG
jgi:translation initiation factor 1